MILYILIAETNVKEGEKVRLLVLVHPLLQKLNFLLTLMGKSISRGV